MLAFAQVTLTAFVRRELVCNVTCVQKATTQLLKLGEPAAGVAMTFCYLDTPCAFVRAGVPVVNARLRARACVLGAAVACVVAVARAHLGGRGGGRGGGGAESL